MPCFAVCRSPSISILSGNHPLTLTPETFLYGFLVPIVGTIFQDRLHVDPSRTQQLTSAVLAIHGAISVVSGPIIGHFADRTPNRKTPLLISLASCIVGTALVAAARSVLVLFLGRVMQGVAGSAVWIIGFATVADTADHNNLGTVMGVMMSFVKSGTISGPAISGLLIEAAGYWVTWSVPLLVLTIDLLARVVMIETPACKTHSDTAENASLLSARVGAEHGRARNFYRVMLCDARALTCLLVAISSSTVSTSFHATLPLYVQETFHWGPGMTGFLFACFVVPTLVVGPVAGWARDRVGSRAPAVVASVLQVVLFGLLGIAGSDRVPWASPRTGGPALYIACIAAIGALRPFVTGIGPVELFGETAR